MARFHSVLFDLDGTLVDTVDLIVKSFQHAFATELGLQVDRAQVLERFAEPLRATMVRLAGEEHADRLVAAYRRFNHAHHDSLVRPIPGVREMLAELHRAGIRLAVVTSKLRDTAMMGLRVFGLDAFVDAVVAADDVQRHKPEPEPVTVALERLGTRDSAGALMVGDSPLDLLAGRAAGTCTCAVGWSIFPAAELAACLPDFWAHTPADLVRFCLGSAHS